MAILNFILLVVAIGSSWMLLFQMSVPYDQRQDDCYKVMIVSTLAWSCLLIQLF